MYRIGYSRDIHRLVPNRPLIIGGIAISHDLGFEAHSDGDIVLHAITEALFGALALGDLGTHFPNDDPQYRDRPSSYFVTYANNLVKEHGYHICNIDVSITLETPKLRPYIALIVKNIAQLLQLQANQVSVKAGTNEGLGYLGTGKAAEATCVVLIEQTAPN